MNNIKLAKTEYPIIEPIAKRWSPRAYSSTPVGKEKLLSLFEAARWTASSYNEQPWKFLVTTKEDEKRYKLALNTLLEFNQTWAKNAPVIIIALAKKYFDHNGKENKHSMFDLGASINSLSIQAADMNLYIHQIAGFYPDKVIDSFNVCSDWEPAVVFTVGYLGDVNELPEKLQKTELAKRSRKPMELVVEF